MAMVRWQLVSTTRPASSADLDGVSALRKRAAACFLVGAGRRDLPLSLARRHRDGGLHGHGHGRVRGQQVR